MAVGKGEEHLDFRKTTAQRTRIDLKPKIHGDEFKEKLFTPTSPSEPCLNAMASLLSFSSLNKKERRMKLLIPFPTSRPGQVLP